MEWRQFVMKLGTLPANGVEEIFERHGAEAVTADLKHSFRLTELPPHRVERLQDQNSSRNKVDNRLTATLDAGTLGGKFDVVVANILAGILVRDAVLVCRQLAAGGRLLLTGVLEDQVDDVRNGYCEWIEFEEPAARPPWVRLTGTRP